MLEIDNLKVYFFTRKGVAKAVDGISFNVNENEMMGLIGESGCGKTTTALSVIKLLRLESIVGGKIMFEGRDIVSMNDREIRKLRGNTISIVRQEAQNGLNPVMTVGDQIIEMILSHEKVTKAEARQRARHQLNLVGINDARMKSYPHEFSGGMKQRVMIAIATACYPRFLILDEPTTGLDVIVQRQILTLIRGLKERLNLTAMLISHDLSVVAETCDKVAVMYAGKIAEQSDTVSLYKNPLHPYSQALIGAYPSLKGEKRALKGIPGSPPDPLFPPSGCRFAPRCAYAAPICKKDGPPLVEKHGRFVSCHRVENL
jgi:oligopeptide/dipeptide ABC transporter ATP-binding protein